MGKESKMTCNAQSCSKMLVLPRTEYSLLVSKEFERENTLENVCIISYKKRIASPGLKQDTVCSGLVHWDDPEGWYREGGGGGFSMGHTCTPVADSC